VTSVGIVPASGGRASVIVEGKGHPKLPHPRASFWDRGHSLKRELTDRREKWQ
jgi:hypothetical protein